ncbi:hypothetical protein [Flavonifractor sp. An306]|uniref:hypothetical protein n=1 Tax=Flavonifractor sp. An306 TaxID=1965629 RepID=UPI0017481BB6|nr:hypothetical protein [Flavonifractor sp. An306]
MRYTLIDQFENLIGIDLDEPPVTIGWEYIVQDYHFGGKTRDDAERTMVQNLAARTPYRSLTQVAKHMGYHLVSIDRDGKRYIRSGNLPQGPFYGEDEERLYNGI